MKKIDIICIIDKSGSMKSIAKDSIEGFNNFLNEQKSANYEARLSLLLFNSYFQKLYDNIDIQAIEPLNDKTYIPDNMTSLYDAIGMEIDSYLDKLSKTPKKKRSDKALFVILTDGFENSSKTYHKELIKLMIEEMREEFDCEFIFLAANQDACLQAETMGIPTSNVIFPVLLRLCLPFNYEATPDGITKAYAMASTATSYYVTNDVKENLFKTE